MSEQEQSHPELSAEQVDMRAKLQRLHVLELQLAVIKTGIVTDQPSAIEDLLNIAAELNLESKQADIDLPKDPYALLDEAKAAIARRVQELKDEESQL
jgi:hypothetical protein